MHVNDEGARRNLSASAPKVEQRALNHVQKPEQKWPYTPDNYAALQLRHKTKLTPTPKTRRGTAMCTCVSASHRQVFVCPLRLSAYALALSRADRCLILTDRKFSSVPIIRGLNHSIPTRFLARDKFCEYGTNTILISIVVITV